jgi:hypothetical protein
VRRGCISLGNIKCDGCHQTILYPERYLFVEEENGKGQKFCMNCCHNMGMVKPGSDKEDAEVLFNLSND